ncbi:MAG TPA: DUF3667 domain-containing protein [Croceibacterium sp.]|nr:DUF3667 domain-containing protein [Croceibacterium sp.]
MNEIVDAAGSIAEGALLGRAVEPRAGEGDGHTHETACLNCGEPLDGPYCRMCGQRGHVHKTLGAFLHDMLHGVFHFEGKTWRTLPMLAQRPGELTRRYIAGERARFVSPMALFLFSVFLMFAVFQLIGLSPPSDFGNVNVNMRGAGDPAQMQKQLDGLRQARERLADGNPAAPILDSQITAIERGIANEARVARGEPEVLAQSDDGKSRITAQRTGWAFFDHGIDKWRENPGLMAYKLQANSYKFSWLLIPLSVPFVWLMFAWRRRFGPYDHAVFVTYSLCFMTLLFVGIAALGQIPAMPEWLLVLAAFAIPPVHIYKQLKGAYGLTRFSAAWRTMVLLVFITIVLALFVNLLLVLGALE